MDNATPEPDTPSANREYKDSLFRSLFSSSLAFLIELYNAIAGTNYGADTKVVIKTLAMVLRNGLRNDLAFELNGKLIVLIEHQSTLNENIPFRMLAYIVETYCGYIKEDALYRQKPIILPRPEFIVLYNGVEEMKEDDRMLRLRDLYADGGDLTPPPDHPLGGLDLDVPMYNINAGHNAEIAKRSKALTGYMAFVAKAREYQKAGKTLEEAIKQAVLYCIENDYIKEYMTNHKTEIVNMLNTEWDFDTAIAVAKEEGVEDGIEKGMERERVKTARAMLDEGMDVNTISRITGLTVDRILQL